MDGSLKERILAFIEKMGLTKAQFEKNAGLSNGFVDKSGDNSRRSSLDKISTAYPQLNMAWLLTGEGEMLNETAPQQSSASARPIKSYTKGVPYYNVDFLGGFDLIFNDSTIIPEYLIDFRDFNRATCWCNITGHSMEPEINHGDIIALREISDFSFIPYGEIYAIVTTSGMRTIKRIGPSSDPNCYALIPTNKSPEYGVQEIPRTSIMRLFEVLGCMKKI